MIEARRVSRHSYENVMCDSLFGTLEADCWSVSWATGAPSWAAVWKPQYSGRRNPQSLTGTVCFRSLISRSRYSITDALTAAADIHHARRCSIQAIPRDTIRTNFADCLTAMQQIVEMRNALSRRQVEQLRV
jgi:hypothetical protein